jgi:diacylglycerol kinase family enzyme
MIPTTLRVLPDVKPFRVTVDVDGKPPPELTLRTLQVTIANSYRFGTVLENKEAAIDDGMLDLYSVDIRGWRDFLPVFGSAMTGHFHDAGGLRTIRAPGFTIRTTRPRHVFADGDFATMTPAEFRVHPLALTVFAPKPVPA